MDMTVKFAYIEAFVVDNEHDTSAIQVELRTLPSNQDARTLMKTVMIRPTTISKTNISPYQLLSTVTLLPKLSKGQVTNSVLESERLALINSPVF